MSQLIVDPNTFGYASLGDCGRAVICNIDTLGLIDEGTYDGIYFNFLNAIQQNRIGTIQSVGVSIIENEAGGSWGFVCDNGIMVPVRREGLSYTRVNLPTSGASEITLKAIDNGFYRVKLQVVFFDEQTSPIQYNF